jgi:hypothetical protein
MPCHGSDHSSSFPRRRCATAGLEKSVTQEPSGIYQNFRKGRYQSFRNPQGRIKELLGHERLDTTCRYYLGIDVRAAKEAHQKFLRYE